MKDGFYCAGDYNDCDDCISGDSGECEKELLRRKHETPEQFKKRTGREYPDDRAVYYQRIQNGVIAFPHRDNLKWDTKIYKEAKWWQRAEKTSTVRIICANTDFGPPEGDFEVTE